jgi:hypothetical protein
MVFVRPVRSLNPTGSIAATFNSFSEQRGFVMAMYDAQPVDAAMSIQDESPADQRQIEATAQTITSKLPAIPLEQARAIVRASRQSGRSLDELIAATLGQEAPPVAVEQMQQAGRVVTYAADLRELQRDGLIGNASKALHYMQNMPQEKFDHHKRLLRKKHMSERAYGPVMDASPGSLTKSEVAAILQQRGISQEQEKGCMSKQDMNNVLKYEAEHGVTYAQAVYYVMGALHPGADAPVRYAEASKSPWVNEDRPLKPARGEHKFADVSGGLDRPLTLRGDSVPERKKVENDIIKFTRELAADYDYPYSSAEKIAYQCFARAQSNGTTPRQEFQSYLSRRRDAELLPR